MAVVTLFLPGAEQILFLAVLPSVSATIDRRKTGTTFGGEEMGSKSPLVIRAYGLPRVISFLVTSAVLCSDLTSSVDYV